MSKTLFYSDIKKILGEYVIREIKILYEGITRFFKLGFRYK